MLTTEVNTLLEVQLSLVQIINHSALSPVFLELLLLESQ